MDSLLDDLLNGDTDEYTIVIYFKIVNIFKMKKMKRVKVK